MQTDSSASFTYFASASASEWTTTVLMPISRHARWMRRAISPRLAMRIFSNTDTSGQEDQGLPELDRLPVLDEDLLHHAVLVGLDLVEQLHRFDDADGLAGFHGLADFDEGFRARCRRAVERPDHRRLHHMALGFGGRRR